MALIRGRPEFGWLVRRRVLQHPVAHLSADLPVLPFDGCAELWFDDEAGLGEFLAVLATDEAVARDVAAFIDPSASRLMVTAETHVV